MLNKILSVDLLPVEYVSFRGRELLNSGVFTWSRNTEWDFFETLLPRETRRCTSLEQTDLFVASEYRCTRVTNSSVIRIVWMVLESVFFLLVKSLSFLRLLRYIKAPKTINFLRQTLLVLSDALQ